METAELRARLAERAPLADGAALESEDLFGHAVGVPVARVRPVTTDQVAAVVRLARAHRRPVVPVGRQSCYWRPLHLAGAIAIETSDLASVPALDPGLGAFWVGAGAPVRAVDDALRAAGHVLPIHPDAFGDTSIGAMVATGFSSGVGVGSATLPDLVSGLRVVTGRGEVLVTGASAALGQAPWARMGLPDPTSLLFAADGALGIVTEVGLRPRRRAALAQLSVRVPEDPDAWARVVAFADALRAPGLYETLRAVAQGDPMRRDGPTLELDVVVRSPLGAEELDVRVRWVRAVLAEHLDAPTITELREPADGPAVVPRWWGEPGAYRQLFSAGLPSGVDVNVPYPRAAEALAIVDAARAQAVALRVFSHRVGVYFTPTFVNVGLHLLFPGQPARGPIVALQAEAMTRFAALGVVPYRWGRLWGPALGDRLDPVYRRTLHALKQALDPDGILHPGATVWGLDADADALPCSTP